ncbi:hypothetical protein Tco_0888405 [Tanacetum coccineum]
MAKGTVPAPTRTDDQLVPVKARLPIGKRNLLMGLQRKQKNPIFLISLYILQNTNFFDAFTTSANFPSVYIQQFLNTLTMDTMSGIYSFQLDELWFTLVVDLLRNALGITPKDPAHPFVAPPAVDLVIDFIHSVDDQPMLDGQDFSLKVPSKKPKPHVIPYCRFTKLIICYLGGRHNIHKRLQSPLHITVDDYSLGNLKFIPKGGLNKVFGMPFLKDLLTDAIRNGKYYQKYLDMTARKPRQPTAVTHEESVKKNTISLAYKSKKSGSAKQSKPVKEKPSKPTPSKKIRKGKVMKVLKGKRTDHLVNEEDEEPQPAPEIPVDDDEYNLQRGKGKGITTDEQAAQSLLELQKSKKKNIAEEQGEDVSHTVALEERTVEIDEGQAGSDPYNTLESRPPPVEDQAGSNPGQRHVSLAGPNLKPIHEAFIAKVYPKVHESLKHTTDEHVFSENPPSSSRTLSSMKNLDDASTFGDQFIDDKSHEDEPGKATVDIEVKSMVTVPIHQASTTIPPLSVPIINLLPPKPVSPLVELSEFEMKEILHDRMFESGSYKSQPERVTLYDALEVSMDRENREEFIEATTKSQAPSSSSKQKTAPQSQQPIDDIPIRDDVHISDSEDTDGRVSLAAYRSYYLVNPKGNRVVPDVSKPLPLGGLPSQVTIQPQYFFNKDLEYLVLAYDISYWWFKRKEFYITRYSAPSDHRVVRSHMKILSVVSLKTFSRYGYTFLREIVLRRADYKEYKISEADFKNLHLNDFEDIIESYQTKINLTQSSWDATDFPFKKDYTNVYKLRAVIYSDRNNQKKMMREYEVQKFSDGMLTRILEQLDHMVKDYVLFKFNPGMEHRIWSEDDKRRTKSLLR